MSKKTERQRGAPMYVCPDPDCRQAFDWKGAVLDHLDAAHNLGIEPTVRWASMGPSEFQRLIDETWAKAKKRQEVLAKEGVHSPPIADMSGMVAAQDEADEGIDEEAFNAADPGPVPDEPEPSGALESGGGDFGGGGASEDFSDAPSSESVDSGSSEPE